jgi:hypothetical protein
VAPAARVKRRARPFLVLGALALLLGGAVYVQLARERAQAADPLTSIDTSRVTRLEVACRGCDAPRRFEKVDGRWRLQAPFARAADEAAVARLLAIARAPVRRWRARAALDPARLGLDPPQATLTLDGRVLRFGATDPIDGDRYVDVGGAALALVPDRFSARLFEPAAREAAPP